MSILLQEIHILKLRYRIMSAADKIVTQSKSVSKLVRRDKSDKFSHQSGRQHHVACHCISRSALNKVPVSQKLHHTVIPVNVSLNDFTRTRVTYMRAAGILNIRRFVDYSGVS